MSKREEAIGVIEIIKNSKKAHEDWLAYFMEFPDQEKTEEYKHLGDRFFHEKCISDYEKVIKKIEQLQADNEEMADMLIAGSFLGRGTQLIGDMRYQELLKAEAENKDLKEARKKPEPTDEGCTNCKNRLEAEIDRLTAENKLLKWLLGKRRKAEGHWCDVSRLNADLKAKDAEITGLRDYVKSYAACTWDGIGACPECGLERGVFKPQAAIEHGNIITELKAEIKAKDEKARLFRIEVQEALEALIGCEDEKATEIIEQALKEKP